MKYKNRGERTRYIFLCILNIFLFLTYSYVFLLHVEKKLTAVESTYKKLEVILKMVSFNQGFKKRDKNNIFWIKIFIKRKSYLNKLKLRIKKMENSRHESLELNYWFLAQLLFVFG